MGRFDKVNTAKYSEGGVYVEPGIYDVEILAVKQGTTRKGADFFVAEFKVLASTNEKRPVNSEMSWMCTMDKDASAGNIRHFCAVASTAKMGEIVVDEQVDSAAVDQIASDTNPMRGVKLHCVATEITTKAGNPFTKCSWRVVGGADAAA